MSDGKQIDWKTILSKIKVISISVCCSLVVCGACFFGGYKYHEYRVNKSGTEAATNLRAELDNTKAALDAANAELSAAKQHVTELEAGVDSAIELAGRTGQSLESIQQQTNDIGCTSDDLGTICKRLISNQQSVRKSVEELQNDNLELTNRLESIRGTSTSK